MTSDSFLVEIGVLEVTEAGQTSEDQRATVGQMHNLIQGVTYSQEFVAFVVEAFAVVLIAALSVAAIFVDAAIVEVSLVLEPRPGVFPQTIVGGFGLAFASFQVFAS